MREIIIDKNENDQRLDRFLNKYFTNASKGFVQKMIRKKNIKINGKKALAEDMIFEGDKIQLFFSDESLDKLTEKKERRKSAYKLDIVYEDSNIIMINKPQGLLSHGSGLEFEENIVDSMISYLIEKKEYIPRIEKTFTPSICNRLDRNTSGLIIGGKTYQALKIINENIKERNIKRKYLGIVKGTIRKDMKEHGFLTKDDKNNKVEVLDQEGEDTKVIETVISPITSRRGYSLVEIELITGRTHQIRSHLSSLGFPILGDRKYGDPQINREFRDKYGLENQLLHAYKIEFLNLRDELAYLNGKTIIKEPSGIFRKIEEEYFVNRE